MHLTPLGDKDKGKSRYAMDDANDVGTVIKWLDIGGGSRIAITQKSYFKELRYRRHKGWDMPKWKDLPLRFCRGKWFD